MRPALSIALGVAATIGVAGCSLLVSFDDIPGADAGFTGETFDSGRGSSSTSSSGGLGSSTSSSGAHPSSSSSSTSSSSSSSSGVLPCVDGGAGVDISQLDCNFKPYVRPNCASENGIDPNQTLNATNDLVDCNAARQAVCVTHCPHGCIPMPAPVSDNCDQCLGKTGNFCGTDFPGWSTDAANVAIQCTGGVFADKHPCPGGTTCNKANCQGTDDLTTCCN